MKWLYRILRLFFCPHKYEIEDKYERTKTFVSGVKHVTHIYINRCKYCGKQKKLET